MRRKENLQSSASRKLAAKKLNYSNYESVILVNRQRSCKLVEDPGGVIFQYRSWGIQKLIPATSYSMLHLSRMTNMRLNMNRSHKYNEKLPETSKLPSLPNLPKLKKTQRKTESISPLRLREPCGATFLLDCYWLGSRGLHQCYEAYLVGPPFSWT